MPYSRRGYFGLKAETTENTAVVPNVFLGITGFDVVGSYLPVASSPIMANRNTRINARKGPVAAPQGTMTVQVEPKGFGYLLKAVFGAVSSGRYFAISSVTGTFVVGETITGGTSAATATVVAVSAEGDYLIMGAPTGTFTAAGEAITGGTSGATATLGVNAGTVYGHEFKAPQNSLPTYSCEIGYENEAIRYSGVRFSSINAIKQEDNIITAELNFIARTEFKMGRVTAVTTSGSGTKVISVDQTQGLVVGDVIKIFRPSTGAFIDLNGSGVKTNTITAISAEATVSMTVLTTTTAVGDLLVVAPQTPSYAVGKELTWIGGAVARVADSITSAIAAAAASIEDFEMAITNEIEERHAANAANMAGRFPSANHLKGFMGSGSLRKAYADMTFLDRLRNMTQTALQIRTTGDQIGSTGVYYTLDIRLPNVVFDPWNPPMASDALLDEDMPFNVYRDTTAGYEAKALLVTDITAF